MGYSRLFYAVQRQGSRRSAQVILPIVFEVARPRSVIDVGCGVGTWLSVARGLGATRTVGLEGHWIVGLPLDHPELEIRSTDLEGSLPDDERYDLAMSMEVAEHLTPKRAESFVEELCRLSDRVLFSAAIPWQGGTRHLNERPQSYWAGIFDRHGYGARDIVRPAVWRDGKVSYWYRQNAFLYERGAAAEMAFAADRLHPMHFANPWRVVEAWDRIRGRRSPQGQF